MTLFHFMTPIRFALGTLTVCVFGALSVLHYRHEDVKEKARLEEVKKKARLKEVKEKARREEVKLKFFLEFTKNEQHLQLQLNTLAIENKGVKNIQQLHSSTLVLLFQQSCNVLHLVEHMRFEPIPFGKIYDALSPMMVQLRNDLEEYDVHVTVPPRPYTQLLLCNDDDENATLELANTIMKTSEYIPDCMNVLDANSSH